MIPVSEPLLDDRTLALVRDALQSGWISSEGRYIAEFERSWAGFCGVAHGVAVSNGSMALALAVQALALPRGSEVILPSFTIISCVGAVLEAGCQPVLVDCEPDTWCLNVKEVAAKITSRASAIMPVHIYGHVADMAPLNELAQQHGLAIIEDAAEAHGASIKAVARGLGTMGSSASIPTRSSLPVKAAWS
jgi:perosamine synthetase